MALLKLPVLPSADDNVLRLFPDDPAEDRRVFETWWYQYWDNLSRYIAQITINPGGASPFINVRDYGAVGDGVTDDAPAFRAAYAAAIASGSLRCGIYVPGGYNYSIQSYILLDSIVPVTFFGDGYGSEVSRGASIATGHGWFDITGSLLTFQNIRFDGNKTSPTKLLYSDFSTNPMNALLTDDSTFWIHSGAEGILFDRCFWEHTKGYGCLIDAEDADVRNVAFTDCWFVNNRPNLFGTDPSDKNYGSWTGGIFFRGDCRASASKLFAVRNLDVNNCHFRRCTGNGIWGHSLGVAAADAHHTNINIEADFEDMGLDCVEMGNVYGGNVKAIGHRVGYITLTDSDTPNPAFGSAYAVFCDSSGYVEDVNYGPCTATSVNGDAYNLDGVRNCTMTALQADIPVSGTEQYTEDSIALYGPLQNGVLTGRGIGFGNTQQNGGSYNITLISPNISGFGFSAILLAYAKNCKVVSPHIVSPTTCAEAPIQLFSASGGTGNEYLCFGNTIEGAMIDYTGTHACVEETGAGWTGTVVNRVFDTEIIGTPAGGEFLPNAATNSLSGVTTNNYLFRQQVAPQLSAVGESRIYMDSSTHVLMVSQNHGAYTPLAGGAPAGSDKYVQYKFSGAFAGSANFQFDPSLRLVTVAGIAATPTIAATGGFMSSDQGYYTPYTEWNSIQAPSGGLFGQNVNLANYIAMASKITPTPVGSDLFTNNGIQHFDLGVTSFRFRYGTGASTLADAFVLGAGFQASGSVGNDIQAITGGVLGKYLTASDSLFFIQEAAPVLSMTGQSKLYMDSTTHTVKISQNGGSFVDIVGASVVAGSNTQVQYNNSGSFGANAGLTYNSGLNQLTATGGMYSVSFNSTASGATAGFQISNGLGTPFQVDGDGNISAVGTLNMQRDDAGYSYRISRIAATARSYGWLINASGSLVLNDVTAGNVARMTMTTAGLFTWGSAVSIDQAGAVSASGVIASTGASGGFNQSSLLQTAYNTFQSVAGGFKGRNFTSSVYVQVGQSSGAPTMSTGDTVANGCVYYDTGSNTLKVRISGSFVDINTGAAGGVTAIVGTASQVLANGTSGSSQTGSVTLTLPQNIGTSSSVTFGNVTSAAVFQSTIAAGASAAFQIANGLGTPFQVNGNGDILGRGAVNVLALTGFGSYLVNGTIVVDASRNGTFANLTFGSGSTLKVGSTTLVDSSGNYKGLVAADANGIGCSGYFTWNGASYIAGYGTPYSTFGLLTVTIATTTSFTVAGGIITSVTAVSDARLKNTAMFTRGLQAVMGLQPVSFSWNDLAKEEFGYEGGCHFGFTAQNVEKYIPEAGLAGDKGYRNFNRDSIVCALVVAVQELSKEVTQLKAQLN